jgi:UPF0176 protein
MPYQVLLFYKYITLGDPAQVADWVRERCESLDLRGRILVAEEGINGTLEGTTQKTEIFAAELLSRTEFSDMSIKRSEGTGDAFSKLSVKVRDEIVGTRFDKSIDPRVETAKSLTPDELRDWYAHAKEFTVIDMRNDFEYQSGHFKDSINPGLGNSRDLPSVIETLAPYKNKTVVTVCTGGVRCEKMSAYLMKNGFATVYQLKDGMHGYMEKYPAQDFLGTLYTFDKRLVMDFGVAHEVVGKCLLCSSPTEQYVNCANLACHFHFLACTNCNDVRGVYCSDTCAAAVR